MKLIKKHMTFEEYEAKYPKYQTKLLSFSDAEIKEFNSKFAKNNGNKQILDKHALLNKYKWVHIKDRYYQVPRVSKLGKAGIALGGAAAIACAVVLPLTLSGVNLSSEEFDAALTYVSEYSEERKYKSSGTMSMGDDSGSNSAEFSIEVDGTNLILGTKSKKSSKFEFVYQKYNDGHLYEYDPNYPENGWYRNKASSMNQLDEAFIPFNALSKNFSKFNKINKNTWEIKDFSFEYTTPMAPIPVNITASYQFSFNKDKTLKSVEGSFAASMDANNNGNSVLYTIGTSAKFEEMKTHKITDFKEFTKPEEEYLDMFWNSDESCYMADKDSDYGLDIAKNNNEIFNFMITPDEENGNAAHQINNFSLVYKEAPYQKTKAKIVPITKDNVVSVYVGEVEIDKNSYDVSDNVLSFKNAIGEENGYVYITLNFKNDYPFAYPSAYYYQEEIH